jgi:hypothetical protein
MQAKERRAHAREAGARLDGVEPEQMQIGPSGGPCRCGPAVVEGAKYCQQLRPGLTVTPQWRVALEVRKPGCDGVDEQREGVSLGGERGHYLPNVRWRGTAKTAKSPSGYLFAVFAVRLCSSSGSGAKRSAAAGFAVTAPTFRLRVAGVAGFLVRTLRARTGPPRMKGADGDQQFSPGRAVAPQWRATLKVREPGGDGVDEQPEGVSIVDGGDRGHDAPNAR